MIKEIKPIDFYDMGLEFFIVALHPINELFNSECI